MGGAFIGVFVGVVVITVCVILMLIKYRSKKGLRIDDQGGAAFGNAVYDGGTVLLYNCVNLSIVHVHGTIKSDCSTGDDLLVTVASYCGWSCEWSYCRSGNGCGHHHSMCDTGICQVPINERVHNSGTRKIQKYSIPYV